MRTKIHGTPLPHQLDFLRSRAFFLAMFGGYGSGKTHGLGFKLFQLMSANKGLPGGLVCPTTKMFRRDVYPLIREMCGESGIEFEYRKSDQELYFPTTKSTVYIFHGEDAGESIRGPNLAFMLLNEMTLLDWETFKAAIGRVRLKHAPFPQVAGSGTPEDFNWAYDQFIDKPMDGSAVIYADTRKNIHAADWYVKMLENSYDEIAAQQYIDGKFVPKSGQRAFYQFDRHKHMEKSEIPQAPGEYWVHVDFNVYPMAATIYRWMPTLKIPLWGVDEVNIHGADTEELCHVLADKIGNGWEQAKIYPDAMGGRQRHSAAARGRTDLSIMRDFGFTKLNYSTRYAVRDQLNAANAVLKKGQVKWHQRCQETIRDLERVKLKVGSSELDKSDPMRTHWADGWKNLCHIEFPVVKSYVETVSRRIR